MNNKPEPNRQGLQFSERQRWIIILLLLLLVEAACLSFTNLQHLFTKPTTEAVVPVSLEAKKRADYSVDLGDYLSPNINLSILVDILKELDLDEATLNARLATVTAMLAQPIPSATRPVSAQTTGLAPTQTEAIIATPTPLPSPSATLAATSSLPAQTATTAASTPTKASTAQATSTKAYTQPAATSISISRTPTATHKPTRTATQTVTGAPLGSATATLTPTSTQLAPATLTSTATLAATRTSTRTASATATATSLKTSTSTFTTTPTSVPGWTSTPTPTKTTTPIYTHTPTRTATSTTTGMATNTPTNTATATPTPTGTQTPTNTPTSTNTLLPTLTDTPTVTPTSTELVPPTPTSTPTSTPTNSDCYAYPGNGFVPSQDAWINGNQPGQSYGTDTQLHIRPVNNADRRALIQFDLSSIPSGSTILSAVLYVNDETGEDYTVLIYPLAGVWDESVTWDTAPAFDPAAIGSFNLTLTPCVRAAWLDTARVNAWVNDPATNFGVLLYASGGAGEDLLSSREGALPARLVVDYLPPRGVGAGLHSISATITKDSLSNVAVQGPTPPDAARPGQPESSRRRR